MAVNDAWLPGQSFAASDENNIAKAVNGSGLLVPCHYATVGTETFTIASGTVTQIAGTALDGGSPNVGDRILVKDAPSASGTGSAFSSQPGNGVYVVTSNTTNLTLSRVYEMSATPVSPASPYNPSGWIVVVMAGVANAGALLVVTTPSAPGTFTYGTNSIQFGYPAPLSSIASSTMTFTNKTISGAANTITNLPLSSLASGVYATTPAANTLVSWDANKNLQANNFTQALTSTTTSSTPIVLTIASANFQVLTGSTAQTVQLPTTGVLAGLDVVVFNASSALATITASGGGTVLVLAPGTSAVFTSTSAAPTTAAGWNYQYMAAAVASGKVFTVGNTITFNGTDGTTFTLPASSDTLVGLVATQVLTNKFLTPRTATIASSATPTINVATTDVANMLTLATNVTGVTVSGSPVDGQPLYVRIKAAAAQTFAWGSSFISSGVATLPTAIPAGKTITVGFKYDSNAAKFICLAVDATGY